MTSFGCGRSVSSPVCDWPGGPECGRREKAEGVRLREVDAFGRSGSDEAVQRGQMFVTGQALIFALPQRRDSEPWFCARFFYSSSS